ncbi:MFS general substrate transporter [Acaromyces ingoldii]|uniref:MFS general substrate transporter n=1 Tax=Acaromyces ingoldii TaxID=215250 RepID=A0A316YTR7_9BASI|nr:MFS general substrate transporter [Acaromyces ingoldii]PWN92611.1 MFS general substrate transporter [Acaromyces ingoldii]
MAVYDRLSASERRMAVALAALFGFLGPFTSTSVLPLAQSMALTLEATEQDVRTYAVALFVAVMGVAPLLLAAASMALPASLFVFPVTTTRRDSRRSKAQATGSAAVLFLPVLYMLASVLLASEATTSSIAALAVLRCIQSLAISPFLSLGASTIRQLYCVKSEARGAALGCFYAGAVAGPTVGPFVAGCIGLGGIQAWRSLFWLQAALGLFASVMQIGLTVRCQRAENRSEATEEQRSECQLPEKPVQSRTAAVRHALGWSFWLVTLSSCASMFGLFLAFNTLTQLVRNRFDIGNSAAVGALFLPGGASSIVCSVLSGAWSDKLLRPKHEMAPREEWRSAHAWTRFASACRPASSTYERRLIVAITGAGVMQPVGLFLYGWPSHSACKTDACQGGLLLLTEVGFCLLCGGVSMTLTAGNAYLVDIAGSASVAQRVIALNNLFRYALAVAASAGTATLLRTLGLSLSSTVAALASLVSMTALVVVASQKRHAISMYS